MPIQDPARVRHLPGPKSARVSLAVAGRPSRAMSAQERLPPQQNHRFANPSPVSSSSRFPHSTAWRRRRGDQRWRQEELAEPSSLLGELRKTAGVEGRRCAALPAQAMPLATSGDRGMQPQPRLPARLSTPCDSARRVANAGSSRPGEVRGRSDVVLARRGGEALALLARFGENLL
jgi:hypothetical protein